MLFMYHNQNVCCYKKLDEFSVEDYKIIETRISEEEGKRVIFLNNIDGSIKEINVKTKQVKNKNGLIENQVKCNSKLDKELLKLAGEEVASNCLLI